MKELRYILAKVKYKIRRNNKEVISAYFRNSGMSVGNNCNICCNIMTTEPYLVSIGNNVTISGDVQLITHDNSVCKIYGDGRDLFGQISICDNCFIGAGCIIMYGVTIPSNCIIGAGSVVSKSLNKSDYIYAGNPIKEICSVEQWVEKIRAHVITTKGLCPEKRMKIVLAEAEKLVNK